MGAPIVFSLDDHRMKKSDDEKGADANDDSFHAYLQIGISFLMLCSNEIRVSVAVTPGIS